jgi:hypothetical protein
LLFSLGAVSLPFMSDQQTLWHVVVTRTGPDWNPDVPLRQQAGWDEHAAFMDGLVEDGFIVLGGPLDDEVRVVHAVAAESEEQVRATLARDNWSGNVLNVESVERWTILLDGR